MLSLLCRALLCLKTVLNSTPTKIAPFITFPHSIFGEGQGSVLCLFKFQRMFAKGLECAISGDTSSPCGGKPHCWFTDKTVSGMHELRNNTFLHSWHPPACFFPDILLPSIMKLKIHDKEMPPTKRVDEVIKSRTQKSTTVGIRELKFQSYLSSKNFSNNVLKLILNHIFHDRSTMLV